MYCFLYSKSGWHRGKAVTFVSPDGWGGIDADTKAIEALADMLKKTDKVLDALSQLRLTETLTKVTCSLFAATDSRLLPLPLQ